MKNKWLKWLIGIGGISTFTLFLQSIDTNEKATEFYDDYIQTDTENIYKLQEGFSSNKELREQQLMALDWEEGNWDVDYRNEVIIATPRLENPYLERAEQRTRRS
ncbi:hypothetical protein [Calidifontibacillus oryziterrae]|uniref:hypothetical protein n=1 Tax=Calidifontibacillus oryziterrae TaxID=1191699 RepID=UPI0002E1CD61|nr:hypothetical protein [Calidifontibacillus oryziterrae]